MKFLSPFSLESHDLGSTALSAGGASLVMLGSPPETVLWGGRFFSERENERERERKADKLRIKIGTHFFQLPYDKADALFQPRKTSINDESSPLFYFKIRV